MPESGVVVEGLVKRFGSFVALHDVTFVVPVGMVVGLLGPNGAGKTTVIRILSTLLQPDGGRASVAGYDVVSHPQQVRAAIGLTGQFAAVDEDLTGRENLVLVGRLSRLTKAVAPVMKAQGGGRIVNIASVAGKEGNPNMAAYSASKAALIGLTKSIAKEVAGEGICINAVAPAVIRTKILEQLTPEQVDYMMARIPMKRTGEPEEVAAVVHFLASRDCSFVTGQCYDASGGRSTY